MTQYLSRKGIVVIADNVTSIPSGYILMLKRLGTDRVDFGQLEEEMLATGFRVVMKQDFGVPRDLSSPSEDLVKYIQRMTGRAESEVRAAIDDIYSRPNMKVSPNRLAIFAK